MAKNEVRFNLNGLEKLKQHARDYRTRVGVLGDKVARDGEPLSNAEIGVIQIFGSITKKIPPRDFLLFPIEYSKNQILQQMGSVAVRAAMNRGDYKKVFALLGTIAEGFVQQAFESRGFGQWAPNAPATVDRKGSGQPLIHTSELRRAVTSDVRKKGEL